MKWYITYTGITSPALYLDGTNTGAAMHASLFLEAGFFTIMHVGRSLHIVIGDEWRAVCVCIEGGGGEVTRVTKSNLS